MPAPAAGAELERARLHGALRLATGATAAFVFCELMQWPPTFLAAVLATVVLASLPTRPTLKIGVVLIVAMALAALYAYLVTVLFRGVPGILFGLIALSMFVAFHGLLTGKPALPMTLVILCLATIPVVAMTQPAYGGILPTAMVRGMVIAVVVAWATHAIWPRTLPPAAAPPAAAAPSNPVLVATLATAAVAPLVLACLMYGFIDALPMLTTTVMIVANFNEARGRKHALVLIVANFAGGVAGIVMHAVFQTTPSLPFLALLLFVSLLAFGWRMTVGGPTKALAMIACNAMLIIFGSAVAAGPGSLTLWITRMTMFTLAGAFAVGMMSLVGAIPRRLGAR